jgi:sugar phosphate isomerase/epimerase
MDDHGLTPVGFAGGLTDGSGRICQWMGIPAANGGFWGTSLAEVRRIIAETGLRCNYENHPEKSVEEMRAVIEGGDENLGLCVDTGWLGTHGIDAPSAVRTLGPLVRHVHLKDVRRAGAHETCPLGEGLVDVRNVIRALKEIGYTGWYSWEDEPEDRNPMEIAGQMRELIARELEKQA